MVRAQRRVDGARALLIWVDHLWRLPLPVRVARLDRPALIDQPRAVLASLERFDLRCASNAIPRALRLLHLLVEGHVRYRLDALDERVVRAAMGLCPKHRPVVGLAEVERGCIRRTDEQPQCDKERCIKSPALFLKPTFCFR
jgi:hypothetical protein